MSLGFRPTFSLEVGCPSRELLPRLYAQLAQEPALLGITRVPGGGADHVLESDHFTLRVLDEESHFWSPWLNVEVIAHGEGSLLSGRFSPHPAVWTGFMFAYLILGMIGFFSLIFAWALSSSGGTPWTLGVGGLSAATAIALWWASQVGQRLAADQMAALREILERVVSASVDG